jgi:hypothetical protein
MVSTKSSLLLMALSCVKSSTAWGDKPCLLSVFLSQYGIKSTCLGWVGVCMAPKVLVNVSYIMFTPKHPRAGVKTNFTNVVYLVFAT